MKPTHNVIFSLPFTLSQAQDALTKFTDSRERVVSALGSFFFERKDPLKDDDKD